MPFESIEASELVSFVHVVLIGPLSDIWHLGHQRGPTRVPMDVVKMVLLIARPHNFERWIVRDGRCLEGPLVQHVVRSVSRRASLNYFLMVSSDLGSKWGSIGSSWGPPSCHFWHVVFKVIFGVVLDSMLGGAAEGLGPAKHVYVQSFGFCFLRSATPCGVQLILSLRPCRRLLFQLVAVGW